MVTIQIVVDKPLLEATDRAAQQERKNRSALVRDALREHLRRLRTRDFIAKDRAGYEKWPDNAEDWREWEAEAVWPDE